jgi:hypothetical protein
MIIPTMEQIQYTFYVVGILSSVIGLATFISSTRSKQKNASRGAKNRRYK